MSKNDKGSKSKGKGANKLAALAGIVAKAESVFPPAVEAGTFSDAGSVATSRHPEARSDSLNAGDIPAVEGAPASTTRDRVLNIMQGIIDAHKARAASLPAGSREQPEKTAGQWARLRAQVSQSWADNFDKLRDTGIITGAQHEGAIAALNDTTGAGPIYGAQKLVDTVALLATRNPVNVSKLHAAYLRTLCDVPMGSDIANDTLAKGIARYAVVSVTGTAPTQRSSSNYAAQALGIVDATRSGVKMRDCEAARIVRAIFAPAS
jgi:hypothetical protein